MNKKNSKKIKKLNQSLKNCGSEKKHYKKPSKDECCGWLKKLVRLGLIPQVPE